jgi:hypothetical protein
MVGYRVVEIKNGKPYSLFHGTNRSREIKLDQWHIADKKEVQDGSGQKKRYISGWHFLESEQAARDFFERMFRIKENRYVVKCKFRGSIRPKHPDGKGQPCLLADEIFISRKDLPITKGAR